MIPELLKNSSDFFFLNLLTLILSFRQVQYIKNKPFFWKYYINVKLKYNFSVCLAQGKHGEKPNAVSTVEQQICCF